LVVTLVPVVAIGAPASFRPQDAAPYFASGPSAEAAAHLRLEEWTAAAKGFDAYLRKQPRAADQNQAQFLLAYAELKAGQLNEAARHFEALVKRYPLLVDYHRTWAA